MNKYVFLLLSISFCFSCEERKAGSIQDYLELADTELLSAITDYQLFLYKDRECQIERGDSAYVGIYAKDINDSVRRFVLYPIVSPEHLCYCLPIFSSKVNGHAVFFFAQSFLSYNYAKNAVFTISEDNKLSIKKQYFPNRFKRDRDGGVSHSTAVEIYETDNCYLTYLNDTLIDKTYRRGLECDKITFMHKGIDMTY